MMQKIWGELSIEKNLEKKAGKSYVKLNKDFPRPPNEFVQVLYVSQRFKTVRDIRKLEKL